jgi:hypothetical protein
MLGGLCMFAAAICVTFVQDNERAVPVDAVIDADRHELLGVGETMQPVPSSGRGA